MFAGTPFENRTRRLKRRAVEAETGDDVKIVARADAGENGRASICGNHTSGECPKRWQLDGDATRVRTSGIVWTRSLHWRK